MATYEVSLKPHGYLHIFNVEADSDHEAGQLAMQALCLQIGIDPAQPQMELVDDDFLVTVAYVLEQKGGRPC